MGWETRLTTTLYFNRQTYDSLYKVENALEETNNMISYFENKLKNLATITEPKKFCEDDQDPLWWVQNETKEALEELEELYIDRFKLQCLKDGWKSCHTENDEPIHPPKEFCNGEYGECSYIDGDFILTKAEEEAERKELYGEET